jgi:peptidoglycan hydrolase-like protein with peptidoglycan-binding domain
MDNKQIQIVLKNRGYYKGAVDGIFGPLSTAACKAMQTDYNLTADGIPGPITQGVLLTINGIHKAANTQVAKNFNETEFACKDGSGDVLIHSSLLLKLQDLRNRIGRPVNITSGYRNPAYNRTLSGSAKDSQHIYGKAVDIVVDGMTPAAVAKVAETVGFDGIGIYPGFCHVDVRGYKARW